MKGRGGFPQRQYRQLPSAADFCWATEFCKFNINYDQLLSLLKTAKDFYKLNTTFLQIASPIEKSGRFGQIEQEIDNYIYYLLFIEIIYYKFANTYFETLHLQSTSNGNKFVFSLYQGKLWTIMGITTFLHDIVSLSEIVGSQKYSASGVVIWFWKTIVRSHCWRKGNLSPECLALVGLTLLRYFVLLLKLWLRHFYGDKLQTTNFIKMYLVNRHWTQWNLFKCHKRWLSNTYHTWQQFAWY